MKRLIWWGSIGALWSLGCSSPDRDAASPSDNSAGLQESNENVATPVVQGSNDLSLDNIVPSDGKVVTNIGPLVNAQSSEPLKQIFQAPMAAAPQRIYLHHSVRDSAGDGVRFEVDYQTGTDPISLVDHGFLNIKVNGQENLATAGTVRVSSEPDGRLSIRFEDLAIAPVSQDGLTVGSSTVLGNASIVGELQRICVMGIGASERDTNWSSEFCAQYAN